MMDEDLSPLRVPALVAALQFGSPHEKKQALNDLARIGAPALPAVLPLLKSANANTRHDAAYLLGAIEGEDAIPQLMDMLEDDSLQVRWRAAESLIQIGRASVVPLLQELTHKERFGSVIFLESAHHVLQGLNQRSMIGPSVEVMKALESWDKEELVPWAAEKVLEALGREK